MNQHFSFGLEKNGFTVINKDTLYYSKQGYGLMEGSRKEISSITYFVANVIAGEDYLIRLKTKIP
ncbi:hypothetical protein BKP37_06275 [Anaerobacillus alkalilacustris]|uniref:Uncharacterized protein n=1 Tax=Anaerobacillus alkalilacustris TaxID=393763 RepID=A0A1S2LVJ8_9BACI|nr:hypothetical protein [Anaerobacillus alkalilacustris]OIJ16366.1 hypothetical protein BKP37_06275 [Anaerobacillus alkalilacustris]